MSALQGGIPSVVQEDSTEGHAELTAHRRAWARARLVDVVLRSDHVLEVWQEGW